MATLLHLSLVAALPMLQDTYFPCSPLKESRFSREKMDKRNLGNLRERKKKDTVKGAILIQACHGWAFEPSKR